MPSPAVTFIICHIPVWARAAIKTQYCSTNRIMTLLFLRFFNNGPLRIIILSIILICLVRGTTSIPHRVSLLKENANSASSFNESDLEVCLDAYRQLTSTEYSTCKYSTAVWNHSQYFSNTGLKQIRHKSKVAPGNVTVEQLLSKSCRIYISSNKAISPFVGQSLHCLPLSFGELHIHCFSPSCCCLFFFFALTI